MKGTRAALRYGKAILSLAKESNKEEDVNKSMLLIAETIDESKELAAVLNSPVIKAEDKIKALTAIFSDTIDQITLGVISLLGENKRLPLLSLVAKQFSILFDHDKLVDVAKVTTAVPLTKELKAKVLAKIEQLTGNKASVENEVNPDILGGFILRVGDIQYDASISNNLNELRRQFDNGHFVAKI
ncbi:ATP synthase F1 subunit delta [Flavicella sediminum]|uniref:ATP synthase F1 subunit delta n=1 Tax=Flavicella sediminum TaxID=2585141 RepID=UPI00111E43B5|nr:ATP synthase F1 subunit delta [Flavicella sediminum]